MEFSHCTCSNYIKLGSLCEDLGAGTNLQQSSYIFTESALPAQTSSCLFFEFRSLCLKSKASMERGDMLVQEK